MKTEIKKTPASHDSDDLYLEGKHKGFGYIGKKSGSKGLMRCPECGRENYALSVASGGCAWCGFNLNDIEIKHE